MLGERERNRKGHLQNIIIRSSYMKILALIFLKEKALAVEIMDCRGSEGVGEKDSQALKKIQGFEHLIKKHN